MVTINPHNPTPEQKKILSVLLTQGEAERFGWGTARSYKIRYNGLLMDVSLTQQIIKRRSKKSGFRYDVIDDHALGSGNWGTVYPINVSYKINEQGNDLVAKDKAKGNRRIVKVVHIKHFSEALREFSLMQMTPHLSPKYPIAYDNKVFTTTKRIEGRELFDIINEDRSLKRKLTDRERFLLSLNLLKALKAQVIDAGLVHRDLKPENIIVNLESLDASTIDFGLSKFAAESDTSSVGSISYVSPEAILGQDTTSNSDLYSLGRIIALIWRMETTNYAACEQGPKSERPKKALRVAYANDYSQLFFGINTLNEDVKNAITELIKTMTAYAPDKRSDIETLIAKFQQAYELQFPPEAPKKPMPIASKTEKKESPLFERPKESSRKILASISSFFVSNKKKQEPYIASKESQKPGKTEEKKSESKPGTDFGQ